MAAKKTAKKVAKKATPKKAAKKAVKKAAPKKAAAKKPAAKKSATKKAAKKAVKKSSAKKAVKKATPKKAAKKAAKKAVKKATPKKAAKKTAKKAAPKKTAKKAVAKKTQKSAAKKAASTKVVKPASKKTSSAAPSKSATGKSQPAVPKSKGVGNKPEEFIEDSAVITKPRSRKAILSPDEIPDPIPLAHQASMDLGKAFSQKDTRPQERKRIQEDESMWVAAELKAMRKRFEAELEERRRTLEIAQKVLDDLIALSDDGAGAETADTGNATLEREMQISKVDVATAHVEETVQAIYRIDHKTYGLCLDCGKQIGKIRLQEAYPYATLCIECKEAADRAEALKL